MISEITDLDVGSRMRNLSILRSSAASKVHMSGDNSEAVTLSTCTTSTPIFSSLRTNSLSTAGCRVAWPVGQNKLGCHHTIIGVCWGHRQAVSDVFLFFNYFAVYRPILTKSGTDNLSGPESTVKGLEFWNSKRLPWKFGNADFEAAFGHERLTFSS